jgi:hypothetical protein
VVNSCAKRTSCGAHQLLVPPRPEASTSGGRSRELRNRGRRRRDGQRACSAW